MTIGWSLVIGFVFLATATALSCINYISPLSNIKELNVAVISFFYIIGITFFCCFIRDYSDYEVYSETAIVSEIETEEIAPDVFIKTQYKIIEIRKRNWFTGKWGDESTASFEKKVIKINLVNSQNEPITMEEKYNAK